MRVRHLHGALGRQQLHLVLGLVAGALQRDRQLVRRGRRRRHVPERVHSHLDFGEVVGQVGGDALEQGDGGAVVAQHHQLHVAVALQQQALGEQPHAHHALQSAGRVAGRAGGTRLLAFRQE